jgi:hypothetical protein
VQLDGAKIQATEASIPAGTVLGAKPRAPAAVPDTKRGNGGPPRLSEVRNELHQPIIADRRLMARSILVLRIALSTVAAVRGGSDADYR